MLDDKWLIRDKEHKLCQDVNGPFYLYDEKLYDVLNNAGVVHKVIKAYRSLVPTTFDQFIKTLNTEIKIERDKMRELLNTAYIWKEISELPEDQVLESESAQDIGLSKEENLTIKSRVDIPGLGEIDIIPIKTTKRYALLKRIIYAFAAFLMGVVVSYVFIPRNDINDIPINSLEESISIFDLAWWTDQRIQVIGLFITVLGGGVWGGFNLYWKYKDRKKKSVDD